MDIALPEQLDRDVEHRQRLQAEEVEFHQPCRLDPFHVELGHRHVGFGIAIQRHQFAQRPVADHDAGRVGGGVPGQAFEALGDVEGARDHGVLVAERLQLRLAGDRRRQRHRRSRILRHQLGQLVDLAVGHLQHAADVAQHAARLQRTEGDDLRHLVAAVALLHVVDHLAAPVLAEVDVEVRHRDAFGIEEALEQQAEADRIEIGDGQRIGDQRARAGAAAGSDRNIVGLGPFDEVGDDQEIARIVHAVDDVDLEGETLAIVFFGGAGRQAMNLQAPRQSLAGLTLQFRRLLALRVGSRAGADGEARQDRLARHRAERAALGDLDRRCQRLRDVGKQHRHFGAGLEAVIGRQLLAVGLGDQTPAGDAQQRVVGFVVVVRCEIRLVGGDQRQPLGIGKIDQAGLDAALFVDAMALQFDIEAVAEQARQPVAARRRERRVIAMERERNRAIGPAGQGDQILGLAFQPFELDVRGLVNRRLEESPRVQTHQAAIAALPRRQQHDSRRRRGKRVARVRILIAEIDGEFAPHDRLDAVARHLVGEFQRPEHVVGIGQRQRRLAVGFRQFAELGDLDRALQQRIGRMNVEMNESGTGHGRLTGSCIMVGSDRRRLIAHRLAAAMVMPGASGVHAERATPARHPAFPQPAEPARSPPASELGNQLRPDRDHPDKQRNRSQRRRLFHEHPQHRSTPATQEHMRNIVPFLFSESRVGSAGSLKNDR